MKEKGRDEGGNGEGRGILYMDTQSKSFSEVVMNAHTMSPNDQPLLNTASLSIELLKCLRMRGRC